MTEQQRKQTGKFLLVAQIPVYLFSFFIFSQFKGDDTNTKEISEKNEQFPNGTLNVNIPEPKREKAMDKLALMKKAKDDSIKEAKKNFKGNEFLDSYSNGTSSKNQSSGVVSLQSKLDRIALELEKEQSPKTNSSRTYGNSYSYEDFEKEQRQKNEMARLDKMTEDIVKKGEAAEIEELTDVNETMDKLVKVMEMANAMENGRPLPSSGDDTAEDIVVYKASKPKGKFLEINTKGFNEVEENKNVNIDNSFKASFFNQQTLTAGETVKIKLDEPMLIDDVLIEANNFLYGRASILNDRLVVNITSIRYKDYLFPVSLRVYDYDGQNGIHIPGSLTRERVKQESANSIRGMNFDVNSLDQSVSTKAISTGSNLVKDVFSAKVRVVKVTVRPHHKILIKNN